MNLRRCSLLVLFAAALFPLTAPSASATTTSTRQCVESNLLTFDPPVTLNNQGGNFTLSWTRTCLVTTVSDSPVGVSTQLVTNSGGHPGTYLGNCVLLQLDGGVVNLILAGTAHVAISTDVSSTHVKGQVFVPDNVCAMSSASGLGPKLELQV